MRAVMTRSAPSDGTARLDLPVWSTTATLVVTDPGALDQAAAELGAELAGIDAACSRFRQDSEISRIVAKPGSWVGLSPILNDAMTAALRVAMATDYLVDPTVAAAVIAQGYDDDIVAVMARAMTDGAVGRLEPAAAAGRPAPGAWRIEHDPQAALLRLPPGVGLDLGASAKALAADRGAARIAAATGCGVLVGIGGDIAVAGAQPGGDIAVAGAQPAGGWRISIADDHRATSAQQTVSITSGGLATSSTTVRRWRTAAGWAHHIVDPRTGRNPDPYWRTASVAAASCVDANAAATAAIVLGRDAPRWLAGLDLPALLREINGPTLALCGWPAPEVQA